MTKIFFEKPEDTDIIAENLAVEKDCDFSLSSPLDEIKVAVSQEGISSFSYSIAEIETIEPE